MIFTLLFSIVLTQAPDMPVFIGIGQSNMAGRASVHSWDSGVISDIYLLDGSYEWTDFKNPLNIYSSCGLPPHKQKLGPGWSFAGTLKNESALPLPFGMILNARGGSNMSMCWTKGIYENNCYQLSMERIKSFQQKYPKIVIKGVIWHQGESDCMPKPNPNYMNELVQMISDLRSDIGIPELPFIAGQIGMFNPNFTDFNREILKLPSLVENTFVVSSEGLKDRGDLLHFDWQSQHIFGQRYAEAMKKYL